MLIYVGNPKERQLGRPGFRCKDSKMDLKEKSWGNINCSSSGWDKQQALDMVAAIQQYFHMVPTNMSQDYCQTC
jgi:hypothetical protein